MPTCVWIEPARSDCVLGLSHVVQKSMKKGMSSVTYSRSCFFRHFSLKSEVSGLPMVPKGCPWETHGLPRVAHGLQNGTPKSPKIIKKSVPGSRSPPRAPPRQEKYPKSMKIQCGRVSHAPGKIHGSDALHKPCFEASPRNSAEKIGGGSLQQTSEVADVISPPSFSHSCKTHKSRSACCLPNTFLSCLVSPSGGIHCQVDTCRHSFC